MIPLLYLTAFLTFILLIKQTEEVGSVQAIGKEPIYCSIANRNQLADYRFTFMVENEIPAGGFLQVTFPSQYRQYLGIPLFAKCNVKCERTLTEVKFYFEAGLQPGIQTTVEVREIFNPSTKGGTGNFEIRTKKGGNILDENLIFGSIGMGDQPNDLTSLALELHTSGASLNAGETSRYAFKFKTISLIPMDSYFRITVPSEAGFKVSATPACGFITVDGFLAQGTLSCKTEGSRVYITGLGQALPSATSMGLFLEVINPDFAQVSPAWRLEIIRAKTQFLYDWVKELYGPSILPGILTNFNFAPKIATTEISRSKEVLMELKFDLKGEIPEGGVMELIFPSSFTLLDKKFLDIPSTYYITGGLQDKSSNELVTLNFDEITNKLNITSFKKAPAGTTVSMELYLGLPPSTGASQTINLTTYSNSSKTIKIDEDTQNIKVTIPSLSSAISNSASLTSSIASGVGTTDIRFTFQPSVNIPINHKYIISFDSSLTVGNPSSCQRLEPVSSTMETAPCSIAGSSITVNLESATYGLGSGVSINVAGALSVPEVARDYTLDIRIETSAGVLIETYTQQISFTPTVLSGMIFSANPQETNKAAILSLQFTVPFQIPISGTPGLPTDPVSEMRIFFEPRGTTIIDRDVGYGVSSQTSVACRGTQGFLPVLGKYVDCVLFPGLNPFIKLTNYQQLPPGTQVTLELAKFNNPNGDFGVSISVLKLQAGLYQEISKGTSSISLVAAAAATITTAPITQPDLAYTIDNRKVSSQFKIVFELALVNGVNLGEFLIVKLPSYDTGFVQDPNSVVCKINNDVKQCTAFNRADWFKIKLDAALAVGAGIENFLQLENLKWPRYSQENGQVQIDVISATFATLHTYKYANLIQVESNLLEKFTLDLDKLKKKQTNALYTFNFQTKQGIPDGGMIVLEMPSQYTLLASEPKVEILFPDFTNSTSKPLNSYFSSSKVTIENIGAYPPLIDFKVILKGVRNPNTDIVLHDWKLSILLNNFLVDQQDKFLAFSLDPTYIPRTITVNRITAFPDNSDVYADYYFSFTPRSSLGAGADLSIEFPSQYKILPSTPICVVSGALNTFADCVTDLNAIRIVTDTPFLEGTINVRIDNIRNPVSGLTDTFEIQSRYDSELVDQVDPTVSSGKIIQVKAIPPAIYVKSFNFDPQNEGEVSTYTFQFTPPTTLTRTQEIILKFPASFDKNIGRRVRCYPKKNLNGNVLCRFEEKKIIIYNFDPVNVTKDDPIEMEIQGVVNPNRIVNGDAGYVSIGILEAGTTTYLSYVAKAGVIEPKPAAGWTFFHGIDLTNTLARSTSDYIFNLTVFDPIPAVNAGGLVVIELPIEFDLQDQTIPCSAPDSTFGNTTCSIQSNRIFVSGNKQPFNGNFQIKIEKMRNPFEQVETDYFYIKTYDGFRKKIIERSFYTLDPFFRTYTFPGPVIRINGDIPITVEAGTQTVDLYATVDQLSNLNLVLKPTAPPGISFIPFEIPLGIGENKASFRISVTESFEEGDVLVEWSILKDLIPPYFTSIKPFKITITKNRSIPIIISQLNNIPFGGQSLPCMIYIQNAPDTGVEISLRKKFPYKGINLDKDVVYFDSGINRGYFTLSYTDAAAAAEENISSGQIEIALGGLNSKLYTLNEITLTFNIDPEDNTAPKVESLTTISLSQHSCKVRVTTNDVAEVYYMIALRGTAQPPLFEVRNQGPPPYLSTSSRYGKSSIGSSLIAEVTFPNLSAETEYIIYAYAEDRGGNVNGNPGFLIIRTSNKFRAADVILQFDQPFLNDAEKEIVARAVAFKLSLPINKVKEKKITIPSTRRRRRALQTVPPLPAGKSRLSLYVVPVNDNPNYPSSVVLSQRLLQQESIDYIKSKFATYDSTFNPVVTEFAEYRPFFDGQIDIASQTYFSIDVEISLTNYGVVYGIAIPVVEDEVVQPSSYQIWKGFDSLNKEMPNSNFTVYRPNEKFNLKIEGLKSNTSYEVYVTAGSLMPDFPDLMDDANIQLVEGTTELAPSEEEDKYSGLYSVWYLVAVLGYGVFSWIFEC